MPNTKAYSVAKSGLTLINSTTFTTSSAVNIDSVFTSTYRNYRVVLTYTSSVNISLLMRLRAGGTTFTSAKYDVRGYTANNSTIVTEVASAQTSWYVGSGGVNGGGGVYDFYAPNAGTQFVTMTGQQVGITSGTYGGGTGISAYIDQSYTADGFQFLPNTGTITGTVRVYGYVNS
jgi:hypothetical protein